MNYKRNILIIFLLVLVITQDGGGDGGGGDSGGSDYGGSDYGGSDSGGYSDSEGSGSSSSTRLISGIIVGIIVGMLTLFITIVCCIKRCNENSNQSNQSESIRQQSLFQQFKLQKNNVIVPRYNQYEFQQIRQAFSSANCKFIFKQRSTIFNVNNLVIQMSQQTNHNYKLTMRGEDKFGRWTSLGYFNNSDRNIELWMRKQYNDKQKAHQTGRWTNLMYQGCRNDFGNYNGKWYYLGFENDQEYSGQWYMTFQNNNHFDRLDSWNNLKSIDIIRQSPYFQKT